MKSEAMRPQTSSPRAASSGDRESEQCQTWVASISPFHSTCPVAGLKRRTLPVGKVPVSCIYASKRVASSSACETLIVSQSPHLRMMSRDPAITCGFSCSLARPGPTR